MRKSHLLSFLFLFTVSTLAISQQKFGHLNSAQLLQMMPEVKTADAALEGFQGALLSEREDKVKTLETEYQEYVKLVNEGTLSKIQMAEKESKFSEDQQEIAQYEQEIQLKVLKKREELIQPILEKVNKAIEEYAKANGYSMIFDTSIPGALLYVPEGDDLTESIKTKLGIQ